MEEKVMEVDYQKECEVLTYQLEQAREELGKYKQALLNICLKV